MVSGLRLSLLTGGLCLLVAGCAPVGPDFVKPEAEQPAEWYGELEEGLTSERPELLQWWRVFEDPVLNQLMEQALEQNNNLEIAGLRVLEAYAQLGIALGTRFPQSQVAFGEATYVSPADNTGVTDGFWNFGLGASASWEIDFWGRFRRGARPGSAR